MVKHNLTFYCCSPHNIVRVGIVNFVGLIYKFTIANVDSRKTVNCSFQLRYRRKIEKDENFINQVMSLAESMEHCIFQNNAVNIYENYFDDLEPAPLSEKSTSRTLNVFRDPNENRRPVTHLSWSPDGGTKLAVSHCNMNYKVAMLEKNMESYIWQVENPNSPLLTITPQSPIVCLEYNQKDPTTLVSGMYNGLVAAWDVRNEREPVMTSDREVSHRSNVNSILWINSKSGSEFFSGGADGQVIWWDTRKLNEPLDRLLMDPVKTDDQSLSRSYGVSVLEYETTIPTRFMCGTEQGMIFSCNRKGKTPTEKIMSRVYLTTFRLFSSSYILKLIFCRFNAIRDRFMPYRETQLLSRTF